MAPEKEKHRSKADKKSKSTNHSEKKRKRDHDHEQLDESQSQKSKKPKKNKSDEHSSLKVAVQKPSSSIGIEAQSSEEDESPFHLQTSSLYLPLAPISQKHPLEGLCAEHLSPLLLTYYPPFRGVLISYSNPRLSEIPFGSTYPNPTSKTHTSLSSHSHPSEQNEDRQPEGLLLHQIDEYAPSFTWLTADFLLFKPSFSVSLTGYINLQSEGHIGVVCWNLFNASIERKRLPRDWVWKDVSQLSNQEDEDGEGGRGDVNGGYTEDGLGCYVDGSGKKVEGMITFRVREIESSHDREWGFLSIEGTMLSVDEERELIESEGGGRDGRDGGGSKQKAGRRLGGEKGLGATSLGVVTEERWEKEREGGGKKHRVRY